MRIAAANLGPGRLVSPREAADLVDELLDVAPVVMVNEAGGLRRSRAIDRALDPAVRRYAPTSSGRAARAVSILVDRNELGVRRARTVKLHGPRFVGKPGAGPAVVRQKNLTHLEVIDKPLGATIHLLNFHAVASATRSVRYLGAKAKRRRLEVYAEEVAGVVEELDRIPAHEPVVLGTDLNAPSTWYLLAPIRERLELAGKVGTMGRRTDGPDLLFTRGLRVRRFGTRRTVSDHDALLLDVVLP